MSKYHTDCYETVKSLIDLFPIEVDLTPNMLENKNNPSTSSGFEYLYDHETDSDEEKEKEKEKKDDDSELIDVNPTALDDKLIDILGQWIIDEIRLQH